MTVADKESVPDCESGQCGGGARQSPQLTKGNNMYKDEKVQVLQRSLTDAEQTVSLITQKVDSLLLTYGSPYKVSDIYLGEYPSSIMIRAEDEYGSQPDEDSMGLGNGGYDTWRTLRKELALLTGAGWVGFPIWYWSK